MGCKEEESAAWFIMKNECVIKHQDAKSKVDLPYVPVESTMNITRFRYAITVHVDAVYGD